MNKFLLTTALAISATVIQSGAVATDQNSYRPAQIVGVWQKEVTLRNCATGDVAPVTNPIFPSINTFHFAGTMSEHGARFSPATRTTGQGIWQRTGLRTFSARALWQTFDANGFFSGTFDVKGTHTVSADGASMTSATTFTITDPNGVVLVRGCATEVGQRVVL